jgi:hypothetical protein
MLPEVLATPGIGSAQAPFSRHFCGPTGRLTSQGLSKPFWKAMTALVNFDSSPGIFQADRYIPEAFVIQVATVAKQLEEQPS